MGIFNEKCGMDHRGHIQMSNIIMRGPPGQGFKLDSNGDYDMDNKKLVNVANGTQNKHAINKGSQMLNYQVTIQTTVTLIYKTSIKLQTPSNQQIQVI